MYKPFSNCVFRIPGMSFDKMEATLKNKSDLLQFVSDPQIQEAVYLASPVLYKELQKFNKGEIKETKERDRIIHSVVRYISRMSTRCTPFGVFSGCCVGKIGQKTHLSLDVSIERTTRLDMQYLSSLFQALVKKEEVRKKIKYYPNSSMYMLGDKIRYVETLYLNDSCKYRIAEAEYTYYLAKIIRNAWKGLGIEELVILLTNKDITIEEGKEFIDELIDAQILVPELNRSVTGEDYLSQIINLLKEIEYPGKELPLLIEINKLLRKLDIGQEDNNIRVYEDILHCVKKIEVPFNEKYLFQVDMVRKVIHGAMGNEIMKALEKAMAFLNQITPAFENETLKRFKDEFIDRYEDREVPLMEALDPEMGIGYPPGKDSGDISPLIDNLFLPGRQKQNIFGLDQFTSVLLTKTIQCLAEGKKEIIFEDKEIKPSKLNWEDLPLTMYSLFEIIHANSEQPLIKISAFSGSCGANLLGRFCHTDPQMEKLVREVTQKEQHLMPDAILAEIAHLPESRVGNILSRPHIREYELLYLSESDLPRPNLFPVSDLMLSVEQNKLVIRSKKLNRKIVPRLTTAHNYGNNTMPVYRFLCEMQKNNGRSGLYFNWGALEEKFSFRPRVRYSNIILSPASWLVKVEKIKHFFDIKEDAGLITAVSEWRETISLPDKVLMPDNDNELYVDWLNALSIRSLFSIIKKRLQVRFDEFLFDPDNSPLSGLDGKYRNQCVVAFYKN
ncbi:lantibiotic dehydratase family protein [Parabacteroides pacaensis]|uniref:lantibiotic dehydratase family protein n=1 Tax=Parabacteroides pacaensis TaxID=2086575 RepID=UPI00131CF752|nr:lantibiotic dehydratase family protein [Parabacteroides pacaensis]